MHGQRTYGHLPWACGHVGAHVERRTLIVVAHVAHQVAEAQLLLGFDPQRYMVARGKIAVDVGQVLVHVAAVMPEEAPYAGIGVAHVLEVDGAVGIAEGELSVGAAEEPHLAGETDYIGGVDALHLGTMYFFEAIAVDAAVLTFLLLWEVAYAAQVGVGRYAVVGDSQCHPYGTLAARAFAYHLHYPRLVGVADGDALASAVISVFLNQLCHAGYGVASRC